MSVGLDMGLTLADRIAGDEVAQTIQLMTEYDPGRPTTQALPTALQPR